ncbi:MAG: HAMP domain-containing histidine kinase [Flammeovirgaceae bacterium]|nr:HAMP domain-containing histidine kinase [Flammeovirgaceae bacterium]
MPDESEQPTPQDNNSINKLESNRKRSFLNRYSYLWKFDPDLEKEYAVFLKPSNLILLRLVTFITLFGMSLFLLIDFYRDVDFNVVLWTRTTLLLVSMSVMIYSYTKRLSSTLIHFFVALIALMSFVSAMITATFANMPAYYLTNLMFLIFVMIVTASGLHFRHALMFNSLCLATFLFFSQVIRIDSFYFSQYPHIFSIFIYTQIIGIVLEGRRRRNFLQFKELAEQKKLVEELNQQKNKIISFLSHDISEPLNSLGVLLNLQAKGHISSEGLKPFFDELSKRFDSVSNLFFGLVRWSRTQMNGFVLEKQKLKVKKILELKILLYQPVAEERSLKFNLKADDSLHVYADDDMIRIAIGNLISNALKFAKKDSVIELTAFNQNGKAMIKVSNEGNPVPMEVQSKLFSYQTTSSPGSQGEKGTGIGLAMAAHFVRLNGGKIYLDPDQSKAVRFCIELPCQD